MSNVRPACGLRLIVLAFPFLLGIAPVWGQFPFSDPYLADPGQTFEPDLWLDGTTDATGSFSGTSKPSEASSATVSADALRHPLSLKALRLLQKAMHPADIGNHRAAIQGLQEAVAKEPSVAPYAANFLGLEYLKTRQFAEANGAFEEAARLMPRESLNHSNLSVSLALIGEWDSAEKEARKAIELDHTNFRAASILAFVTSWRQAHREAGLPRSGDPAMPAGGL
jgi:tetratricopeptide (TPR) repeat protein